MFEVSEENVGMNPRGKRQPRPYSENDNIAEQFVKTARIAKRQPAESHIKIYGEKSFRPPHIAKNIKI